MCNFIIRPIKSYATVDIVQNEDDRVGDIVAIERGDWVEVDYIKDGAVYGKKRGIVDVVVPLETFVAAFIASPEAIKKVKEEESKWFPKPKEEKKDSSKESKEAK